MKAFQSSGRKADYLGSYMDGFQSGQIFANQQNFHTEQFHGHSENAKKIDFMQFSK